MKKITLTLPPTAGGSLLRALCKQLPQVPEYRLKQALKNKDVKQNGVRMSLGATCIGGAEILLFLPEEASMVIPVLYENNQIIAVHKPYGISCVPDAHGAPCLPQLLHEQLTKQTPSAEMPIVCHRLDNQTEGVLLLAKNEHTALLLQDAFRNRQIHKTYECLVKGCPQPRQGILRDYLVKDAKHAQVTVVAHPRADARPIVTEYAVLDGGDISRLRIQLHTGRTHQIRAHLSYYGHPLLGDDQYGDRAFNKAMHTRHLALCSVQLAFDTGGELASLRDTIISTTPRF